MNKIYDLKKNKIIINISHRINEMIKYDNFLIIDNNKVNVIGSYENLKTITKQNFF